MVDKPVKKKEGEEKKAKKKKRTGYNLEPAEELVEGPTGKKGFDV
jgi:hypothetical protein